MREKADYGNVFSLSKDEGKVIIDLAADLRNRICRLIKEKISRQTES